MSQALDDLEDEDQTGLMTKSAVGRGSWDVVREWPEPIRRNKMNAARQKMDAEGDPHAVGGATMNCVGGC